MLDKCQQLCLGKHIPGKYRLNAIHHFGGYRNISFCGPGVLSWLIGQMCSSMGCWQIRI
ncbi:hypothetical protein D3C76_215160 [compost metagenome]